MKIYSPLKTLSLFFVGVILTVNVSGQAQCKSPAKWFADTYNKFEEFGISHPYTEAASMVVKFINEGGNGWGKIGPRAIAFESYEKGTLQGLGDRMFISAPCNKDKARIRVKKKDGASKMEVTICSYDKNGKNPINHKVYTFSPGNQYEEQDFNISGIKNRIIAVRLNGQTATKKFTYTISCRLQ